MCHLRSNNISSRQVLPQLNRSLCPPGNVSSPLQQGQPQVPQHQQVPQQQPPPMQGQQFQQGQHQQQQMPMQVPQQQMQGQQQFQQGQVPIQQVPQMHQQPPQMAPQIPLHQQVPMHQQVPLPHPGQMPPHPGQMPPHPGQVPHGQPPPAQPPMTMPIFDENADDAPAVAMEYKVHVDPGKEECYYQFVQKGATIYVSFQVLRGGDGMAGFAMRNPGGKLVHPYQWKPTSEYQEVAPSGGYYGICVDNQFSRFAAKLVNLYITTFRYDQWEKFAQELKDIDVSAENCTQILSGVDKRLHAILQLQQMSRGREARDYNLLLDNEAYVQYWSLAQCLVVIACFLVQVYFVKKLFETKAGRGRI
uniref:EOG090X0AV2 n=1 Tax=Alona affinis TaxID=381656 RepID=A0A9N6WP63_9CRUS|nr:EOG090X0AV2 [Alona affinis]